MEKEGQALLRIVSYFLFFSLLLALFCSPPLLSLLFLSGRSWKQEVSGGIKTEKTGCRRVDMRQDKRAITHIHTLNLISTGGW